MVLLDHNNGHEGDNSWQYIPRPITVSKCEKIEGVLDWTQVPSAGSQMNNGQWQYNNDGLYKARIDGETYNLNERFVHNAAVGPDLYTHVAEREHFGATFTYYIWTNYAGDTYFRG